MSEGLQRWLWASRAGGSGVPPGRRQATPAAATTRGAAARRPPFAACLVLSPSPTQPALTHSHLITAILIYSQVHGRAEAAAHAGAGGQAGGGGRAD